MFEIALNRVECNGEAAGATDNPHKNQKFILYTHFVNRTSILREFVLNSRHPGPRREERGLQAAVQMPLPRDPRDPRDRRESSRRLDSMRRRVQIDTVARNWASNFHSFE